MTPVMICRPLRLRYFIRIPNVGDRINPAIVTELTGRQTVWVGAGAEPHLLAAGSMMATATPQSRVWGTGVMDPTNGIGAANPRNIYALRGKLTHGALRSAGVAVADVPLGDPGFLAPGLLGVARAAAPKWRLGLVPHYVDRGDPHVARLAREAGVVILDVHDEPERFLRALADCRAVASSSLHGLIFAEALGVPNLWVSASGAIVGGAFKFEDWFSTTAAPQQGAHILSQADTADALISRARMHDSAIDREALGAAFPTEIIDELCEDEGRRLIPTVACRRRPIPTFLISFDRGAMLERSIASLKALDQPTEIVVHDNGSADPATLAILDRLEQDDVLVARREKIEVADDLNRVDETVKEFFSTWAEPSRYVVSDCDIDLAVASSDALAIYDELLNRFRHVASVGPMLRIRDIPHDYPLFHRVMNRHVEQFWHKRPEWVDLSIGRVAYLDTVIDTTLALHRAGEPFHRLKRSLRVYEPYEARHLDWYVSERTAGVYNDTSSPEISHWNNAAEWRSHADVELQHTRYYVVRAEADGSLSVGEEQILPRAEQKSSATPIAPFVHASQHQRDARMAHTESLRSAGASDIGRWSDPLSHYDSWRERGVKLAGLVKAGERVFEFGAGRSIVADHLPGGCRYCGSDVAPLKPDVVAIDLNAPQLRPIHGYEVALFSGVLEYVHDLPRLIRFLSRCFGSVICSYAVATDQTKEEMQKRRYSGWFNDFKDSEIRDLFNASGFRLSANQRWLSQELYRWDAARELTNAGQQASETA
jgi:hypothetical protein